MKISELELLGLSTNGARIFLELLIGSYFTPKLLSETMSIPLQSIYQDLKLLEQMGLIKSRGVSPKEYFAVSPQKGLKGLIIQFKSNLNQLNNHADKVLDKAISLYQAKFHEGRCLKRFAFFTYKDFKKGMKYLQDQITLAQVEVMLFNLPKQILMDVLESVEYAFNRGVWAGIYLDKKHTVPVNKLPSANIFQGDFQGMLIPGNFLLDDEDSNQAVVCIDKERFISILHREPLKEEDVVISSFYSPQIVSSMKSSYLAALSRDPIVRKDTVEKDPQAIDFIKNAVKSGYVTKREILEWSQRENFSLTGGDIKRIVEHLEKIGAVTISKVKQGKGRPRDEISLSDN